MLSELVHRWLLTPKIVALSMITCYHVFAKRVNSKGQKTSAGFAQVCWECRS